MLFKMHHFDPGIIYLCEKLQLHEELLQFYIDREHKNKDDDIIAHCQKSWKTYGTNLWVQALKYFISHPNKVDRIPDILEKITDVDTLSPLLVLNILSQNGNIPFEKVSKYF